MSSAPLNTQDDSRKDSEERNTKLFLGFLFIIVTPITVLTAWGVYLMFSYLKIKRSVILLFSSPFLVAALLFIIPISKLYISSWTDTFPKIIAQETEPFIGILTMLAQQFLLSFPLGILVGLGVATWRWFTRARWQKWEFRKTPWEVAKFRRNIAKIKNDEDTPVDGMTLGIEANGERVVQTYDEASAHTLIIGGSGSGKSRTAMMRIRDQIKKGEASIIIDLKDDPELTNFVKIMCDRYGRKFQHFTMQDNTKPYTGPAPEGNAHYDPLAQGDHTRRADMVLDLQEWTASNDVFKKLSQSYLQLLFTVLIQNPRPQLSTLEDAIDLMNPKYLQERARPLAGDPRFSAVMRSIDSLNDEALSRTVKDNLQTNRSQLEIFLQSIAGPWLMLDNKNGNNINILDAAYNGDVIVFSLDSQAYGSLAAHLANLIIQDLKTVSSELLRSPAPKPVHVFIDEFSAIGSDNIINLLNKARAANMSITLATQTIGDLMVNNPALKMQIMGIVSSFIIHRANTQDDATVYSGLTGMTTVSKVRHQATYNQDMLGGIGAGIGTGNASVEEVEEWKVKPTEIQELNKGQMFFISTTTHRIKLVQCIIEDIADPTKGGTSNAMKEMPMAPTVVVQEKFSPSNPLDFNQPLETVNEQFTPADAGMTLQKGDKPVTRQPKEYAANSDDNRKQEIADLKKVPVNYGTLRTFFNNLDELSDQEQQDIADGVPVIDERMPAATPTIAAAPSNTVTPSNFPNRPALPPAAPRNNPLPKRPAFPGKPASTPKKTEFDF